MEAREPCEAQANHCGWCTLVSCPQTSVTKWVFQLCGLNSEKSTWKTEPCHPGEWECQLMQWWNLRGRAWVWSSLGSQAPQLSSGDSDVIMLSHVIQEKERDLVPRTSLCWEEKHSEIQCYFPMDKWCEREFQPAAGTQHFCGISMRCASRSAGDSASICTLKSE